MLGYILKNIFKYIFKILIITYYYLLYVYSCSYSEAHYFLRNIYVQCAHIEFWMGCQLVSKYLKFSRLGEWIGVVLQR